MDHHQRSGLVNTHNDPLKSGKGSIYEGGIRVPMIVKWPEITAPKSINQHPVIIEDFFPTILEMANIDSQHIIQETDGQSFVRYLKNPGKKESERPLVFHYPSKWINIEYDNNLGINYFSAIRYGKWKIIYNMRNRSFELYDLSNDIGEKNNLAASNYPVVKKLARILGETLKARDAQMPVEKATGKAVPFPDEEIGQ